MLLQAKLLMTGAILGAAAAVAFVAAFDEHSKIARTVKRMKKEESAADDLTHKCGGCEDCDCPSFDNDSRIAYNESIDNLPEEFFSDECDEAAASEDNCGQTECESCESADSICEEPSADTNENNKPSNEVSAAESTDTNEPEAVKTEDEKSEAAPSKKRSRRK